MIVMIPESYYSGQHGAPNSKLSSSVFLSCRCKSSLLSESNTITFCSKIHFPYSEFMDHLYVGVELYERVGPRCCVDFVTILIVKLLERWMFLEGTSWNIKFPKFSTSPSPSPSSYRNITEMKKHLDSTCAKSSRKA